MEKSNELFYKKNTIFGCLVGASFIISSLIFVFAGKGIAGNPQLNNIIMMLTIFGIFMGVKKYRDDQLLGLISYGKALTAGIYILAIAALCNAVYTFIIYSSNAELLAEYKKIMITTANVLYKNWNVQELFDKGLGDVFFTPLAIAFGEMINRLLVGAAFTLFIAGLVKRNASPVKPQ